MAVSFARLFWFKYSQYIGLAQAIRQSKKKGQRCARTLPFWLW